jgi:hypothetical protein
MPHAQRQTDILKSFPKVVDMQNEWRKESRQNNNGTRNKRRNKKEASRKGTFVMERRCFKQSFQGVPRSHAEIH